MNNFKQALIMVCEKFDIFEMAELYFKQNESIEKNPFTKKKILELGSTKEAAEFSDVLTSLTSPIFRNYYREGGLSEEGVSLEKMRAFEAELEKVVIRIKTMEFEENAD